MTEEEKKLQEMAQEVVAQAKKEKKIIRLHYLPDAIKQSIKDLIEFSEDEGTRFLFEDISILVEWALNRLPILPPPSEKKDGE